MEAMNWDAVAASAEVIGVIAVLASILYLAKQVAQGNRLNESDSVRTFLNQYNAMLQQLTDPEMNELLRRGVVDFDSLTDPEKSRLHMILWTHYMLGQAQRMIDPAGGEELSKFADYLVSSTMKQPGFQKWWRSVKHALPDQEYVQRIDDYVIPQAVMWENWLPWFTSAKK